MLMRVRLWIARLLRRLVDWFERCSMPSSEVKDYFESMFFNCYFSEKYFPEGPPPSLRTVNDSYRDRILKGIAPSVITKRTTGMGREIWIEDIPSSLIARREKWGDLNNTVEELERIIYEKSKTTDIADNIKHPVV